MGKKRVVIDTNILISALGWEGKPRQVFQRVLNNEFELILPKKQLEELRRVMDYPKFEFTDEQKSRFIGVLLAVVIIVETHDSIDIIKDDPSDNVILEAAVENNAHYLISGDDHLLRLKEYRNVRIITANGFLQVL